MSESGAIGVFDSGVGGLTVARALVSRLAGESLIYLGDTARVPYGSKSAATVARYSELAARFLLSRDVKLIVIACNTASAFAMDSLRATLSVPVLGVIEPGAERAAQATRNGHVGVIGTLGTVRSGAYVRALNALNPALVVTAHACPMLVPLAEEGWVDDDPITEAAVRRYLQELKARDERIDVLVLGCTHYPILKATIAKVAREVFAHEVALVDSAEAMANAVADELTRRGIAHASSAQGTMTCCVTDDARIAEVGARFFGRSLGEIERVDL